MISAPRSSFASTKRRQRLPWPKGQPFRILSLDGGGIKGIFPAALLSIWEQRYLDGRSICECFDSISGTSTGGILALGLGAGKTAGEMLQMYMEEGKFIFPPGWFRRLCLGLRGIALYRYDRAALTQALTSALRDMKLSAARVRLCIPAFEGHHGEVYIFKTPHHPDYKIDGHETLVKIGQATAAAPSFFSALDSGGYRFVDGGIWANNPIMIAITDALACNKPLCSARVGSGKISSIAIQLCQFEHRVSFHSEELHLRCKLTGSFQVSDCQGSISHLCHQPT